jgi:hypothetical protein
VIAGWKTGRCSVIPFPVRGAACDWFPRLKFQRRMFKIGVAVAEETRPWGQKGAGLFCLLCWFSE